MRRKVCWQSGKSSGCRIRCELPGATSKRTNEQEILCTARNLSKDILLAAQGPRSVYRGSWARSFHICFMKLFSLYFLQFICLQSLAFAFAFGYTKGKGA